MELLARLNGVSRDYLTGLWTVSVQTDSRPDGLDQMRDKDLTVSIKTYKARRTMSANAYYWVLVGKLAGALHISNNRCHNILLRRYGQPEVMDGQLVCVALPDTDEVADSVLEKEHYHLRPTSRTSRGSDGRPFRIYTMLRGSHDYDSDEFGRLLDGTIDECKEAGGIETLPPAEIERMMELYEKQHRSK